MRIQPTPVVYGRDVRVQGVTRTRFKQRRSLNDMAQALRDKLVRPKRRPMMGGHASYVGPVSGLCVGDMVDKLVVDAVVDEMMRRGIQDLWGTRFADEIVEDARASLVKRNGPHDARTPREAARMAVGAAIGAGRHLDAREGRRAW